MQNTFTNGYKFVGYLENFEDYGGNRDQFSKFGLIVNDEIEIIVEPELFKHQVDGAAPAEGDLIYFPIGNALFEVVWNEDELPFYSLGIRTEYKIKAQKFIYSGETMNVTNQGTIDTVDTTPFDEINELDDRVDIKEPEYRESDDIQTKSDAIVTPAVDLDEDNPFGIEI